MFVFKLGDKYYEDAFCVEPPFTPSDKAMRAMQLLDAGANEHGSCTIPQVGDRCLLNDVIQYCLFSSYLKEK